MEIYRNLSSKNIEGEIWKDIEEYEGLYEVSSYGRVKSLNYNRSGKEKIMKQQISRIGYLTVGLTDSEGKTKRLRVHRLVAQTFIENKENKLEVDHISTVKTDNRVENLRWVTHKENSNNELTRKHNSKSKKGKKHTEETRKKMSEAKKGKVVSEETRKKIKGRNNSNYKGFIALFPNGNITEEMGGKALGELLGASENTIIKIAKSGEPYKTSHKKLKYLNGIRIFYAEDYKKLVGDEIA